MERLTSRVKINDRLAQIVAIKVSVDFCGRDGLMAQHLLYRPQVCPAFYQVRGKGMPKRMRAHLLVDTSLLHQLPDDGEYHYPREGGAPFVEKDYILKAWLYGNVAAYLFQVHFCVF